VKQLEGGGDRNRHTRRDAGRDARPIDVKDQQCSRDGGIGLRRVDFRGQYRIA
jgi:hypothetical protein